MRVYFIRHGESVANAKRVMAGQNDVPLTEHGRAQAQRVGEYLKKIPFDAVHSGDLCRAADTCRIAMGAMPLTKDAGLREIDVGELVGLSGDDCDARYGQAHWDARRQLDFSLYGGESHKELSERICCFLQRMEQSEHKQAAVFTHGGWMLALLEVLWDVPIAANKIYRANCMVMAPEYQDGNWKQYGWNMG